MKRILFTSLFIITILTAYAQSVGINADGTPPNASAILDVKSTTKGMLVPRMTSSERTGINNPAIGLLVYDSETASFWFYKSAGWTELTGGGGGGAAYWNTSGTNIYNANNGNVGIGTNNPLRPLTLKAASNSYGFSHTDGTRTLSTYIGDETNGNGVFFGTETNHPLYFFTNSSAPLVTITTTGYFGIGTRVPANKLTVQTLSNDFGLTHTDGTVTVGSWIGTFQGATGGWLGTKSIHPLNFFTGNGAAQMTLAINGNFGIGTQTPVEKLTVQTPNDSYGISHRGAGANLLATYMGGTSAGIGTFSNTNMRIFANGVSAVFISSGTNNVGIGIDFPTYKLEVNGNVRSKEVVVENANWPDYVFDEAYQLPSLDHLEKFIQEYKHLPNIPSAKEIEKNGLFLGDTQKKMMEKIEELTLYSIELKKEMMDLRKEMAAIKKANQ